MTSTTTVRTDLGNGWTRDGQDLIWASELHPARQLGRPAGSRDRDLLRLSVWTKGTNNLLRIEVSELDAEDDPADSEAISDAFTLGRPPRVELPFAALPELAYTLTRFLMHHNLWAAVVDRIATEMDAELQQITGADDDK